MLEPSWTWLARQGLLNDLFLGLGIWAAVLGRFRLQSTID